MYAMKILMVVTNWIMVTFLLGWLWNTPVRNTGWRCIAALGIFWIAQAIPVSREKD